MKLLKRILNFFTRKKNKKIPDEIILVMDDGKKRSLSWGSEFSVEQDKLPTLDHFNNPSEIYCIRKFNKETNRWETEYIQEGK